MPVITTKAVDAPEANKVAAKADEAKKVVLESFAKTKVDQLVAKIVSLDKDLKEQFDKLVKLMEDTELKADFDPTSVKDLTWVS